MKKKLFLGGLVIAIVAIVGVWFFVFYKPTHFKRDVADEKGIVISSAALVQSFQSNETAANGQFLNKAIEVTGEIGDIQKNNEGKTTVSIKSNDAFAGVFCTLKMNPTSPLKSGQVVTIKGVCTGFLSDVVIIDAIVIK